MNIRPAKVSDAVGIAHVHVESWKTTYKGIVAESYLSNLSVEERATRWTWIIDQLNDEDLLLVVEDDEQRIVGFLSAGPNREQELDYDAELYAVYLLQDVQRCGVGTELFRQMLQHFRKHAWNSYMVWVLEGNSAILFYERQGGVECARQSIQIGDETHLEIALGWREVL